MSVDPVSFGLVLEKGSAAFETGLTAWKNRDKAFSLVRKAAYIYKYGVLHVAVVGASGTGKTTLGHLLTKKSYLGAAPTDYKPSPGLDTLSLVGDVVGKLHVAPGQPGLEHLYFPDLYRGISAGRTKGIINVVAWGHHAFSGDDLRGGATYQTHPLYTSGMSVSDFVQKYVADRRVRELELLKRLVPHISSAPHKTWMLTLITKQDLWWNNGSDVASFYVRGEYASLINEVARIRGLANFRHEFRSVSLTITNLTDPQGNHLVDTTSGYDQSLQFAHFGYLLSTIDVLAKSFPIR